MLEKTCRITENLADCILSQILNIHETVGGLPEIYCFLKSKIGGGSFITFFLPLIPILYEVVVCLTAAVLISKQAINFMLRR